MKQVKGERMVKVPAKTVYFASADDPKGEKHVAQKYLESESVAKFLMVAIAKSGISLDSLDFPGVAELMKQNAEQHALRTGEQVTYPGNTIVHQCVLAIRETRAMLDQIGSMLKVQDQKVAEVVH